MEQVRMMTIHDLIDPKDNKKRTYKEVNLSKEHEFEIGRLVEIIETGVRLFIVNRTRDCDGTPLYSLCHDKDDTVQRSVGFGNHGWINGYSCDSLHGVATA